MADKGQASEPGVPDVGAVLEDLQAAYNQSQVQMRHLEKLLSTRHTGSSASCSESPCLAMGKNGVLAQEDPLVWKAMVNKRRKSVEIYNNASKTGLDGWSSTSRRHSLEGFPSSLRTSSTRQSLEINVQDIDTTGEHYNALRVASPHGLFPSVQQVCSTSRKPLLDIGPERVGSRSQRRMSCTMDVRQPCVGSRIPSLADRLNSKQIINRVAPFSFDGPERVAHAPADSRLMTASTGQDDIPRMDPDVHSLVPARTCSRTTKCLSTTASVSRARFSFADESEQHVQSAAEDGPTHEHITHPHTACVSARAQRVSFQESPGLPRAQPAPAPASVDSTSDLSSLASEVHAVQHTRGSAPPETPRSLSNNAKQEGKLPAGHEAAAAGEVQAAYDAQHPSMQGLSDAAGAQTAKQGFASRFLKRAVASSAQLFGIAGQATQPRPPQQGVPSKYRHHA